MKTTKKTAAAAERDQLRASRLGGTRIETGIFQQAPIAVWVPGSEYVSDFSLSEAYEKEQASKQA
ncbi:MAG: hypothetical protein H0U76_21935 [Ktedonobacteraceae bacterium]|nr:hypothetical protein [Ktedonobacteraceae bacterium]